MPYRKKIEALRNALAINRGIEIMDPDTEKGQEIRTGFTKLFNPTANHVDGITSAEKIFSLIHEYLFEDWRKSEANGIFAVSTSQKRGEVSKILGKLLWDKRCGLLNESNNAVSMDVGELADALAEFYSNMRKLLPFKYGNVLTIDFFLTALFDRKKFRDVWPDGIDFRRLGEENAAVLLNKKSSHAELVAAFRDVLDGSRTPALDNPRKDETGFFDLPNKKIEIEGIPFLSFVGDGKTGKKGQIYIVAVNGGLVKLSEAREKLKELRRDQILIGDLEPFETNLFLPGTEKLRAPGKNKIDGISVSDNAAPLCCLDIDVMTGLRSGWNDELKKLIKSVGVGEKENPFKLANNKDLKAALIKKAVGNPQLTRCVEIAYERLSALVPIMDDICKREIDGKTASEDPQFFMSMGGGGSGKGVVEDMVSAKCGDNYVKASLDEFRKHSDLYRLLIAAGHHSDDYRMVEKLASSLRDWVTAKARDKGLNILYDGTGIPYDGKYGDMVKDFKHRDEEAGKKYKDYTTCVVAVDNSIERSIGNVQDRMKKDSRILPWNVVKEKHQGFPSAFMAAADDRNLDHLCLFGNDAGRGEHRLIAELDRKNFDAIKFVTARENGRLGDEIGAQSSFALSLLKNAASHVIRPQNDNAALLSLQNDAALLVYDAERFTKMIEKGQLNTSVSKAADIHLPSNAMKFVVSQSPTVH